MMFLLISSVCKTCFCGSLIRISQSCQILTIRSGVDKGGLSPPNELKDHPCEKMKSEEKLGGGAMAMCNPQK